MNKESLQCQTVSCMKYKTEDEILQMLHILFDGCLDRKQIRSPELLAYFAGTKMLALISGMLVYG